MTQEQIKNYEYCKNHLAQISEMEKKSPFTEQMGDCGYRFDIVNLGLEEIHSEMYNSIINAIEKAKAKIYEKIDKL